MSTTKPGNNGKNGKNGKYRVTYLEVIETDNSVTLMADVPGGDGDGVDVSVDRGILTLNGKLDLGEHASPRYRNCVFGDFFRLFRLSRDVDRNQVQAAVEDGILRVTIPKWSGSKGQILGFKNSGRKRKKPVPVE